MRSRTGTEMTAGTSPIRTSENANVARGAASTTSAAARMPMPPALAAPATLAITGFGQRATRCRMPGSSRTPSAPAAATAVSFRSMPAQNTGPEWVSTTTRLWSSAVTSSSASRNSDRSRADRALRFAGESRVMVAIPAVRSRRTSALTLASCHRPATSGPGHAAEEQRGRPVGDTGVVPSTLPEGDPVPADGSLPPSAAVGMAGRTLSIYLHVPFCATRCGYCDFNTYTAGELGSDASPQSWKDAARAEIALARRTLTALGDTRPVSTVFVGGGTPSLVGSGPLTSLLAAIREEFGLAEGAEVTTEANPESTDAALLEALRHAGYTRLSLGMQSASPRVLAVLDRVHTPGRPAEVVALARQAGFEHLSLDLIY